MKLKIINPPVSYWSVLAQPSQTPAQSSNFPLFGKFSLNSLRRAFEENLQKRGKFDDCVGV